MKKVIDTFERQMSPIFDEIWASIRENGLNENELCEFRTQIGRLYKSGQGRLDGMAFSGRCPNGWDSSKPSDRHHLLPQHNSAMLTVIRLIANHFYEGESPEDHIFWSNSAHICNVDAGNAGKKLWNAQQDGIRRIASLEQELLRPQVSVYITGTTTDWDTPLWEGFLNERGCSDVILSESITNKGGRVCNMLAYECDGRLFVITDRPEAFSRELFSEAVIRIIERWLETKEVNENSIEK